MITAMVDVILLLIVGSLSWLEVPSVVKLTHSLHIWNDIIFWSYPVMTRSTFCCQTHSLSLNIWNDIIFLSYPSLVVKMNAWGRQQRSASSQQQQIIPWGGETFSGEDQVEKLFPEQHFLGRSKAEKHFPETFSGEENDWETFSGEEQGWETFSRESFSSPENVPQPYSSAGNDFLQKMLIQKYSSTWSWEKFSGEDLVEKHFLEQHFLGRSKAEKHFPGRIRLMDQHFLEQIIPWGWEGLETFSRVDQVEKHFQVLQNGEWQN